MIQPSLNRTFTFEVVTVDEKGSINDRHTYEAKYYIEDLNESALEMVSIPGDKFLMGSAYFDGSRVREYPQHAVIVPPFFMGKYPITQRQWKAIASLPKLEHSLNPDCSNFKGDDRPVETVSWFEAIEFCRRLSDKTGKSYRLPSEAEWEYACRGGSQTPFAYGKTITTDLVNFNGNMSYRLGPFGKYRKQTIDVGSFPPNAFGLHDMHGNVWEWCQDDWHSNYDCAPTDGSAWTDTNYRNDARVIRGGSWDEYPSSCRSAYRSHHTIEDRNASTRRVSVTTGTVVVVENFTPVGRNSTVGFRVVCDSPRTS